MAAVDREGLMVDSGSEVRKARLAALMKRAEIEFDRSRRLVEASRMLRAEAQRQSVGTCLGNSAESPDAAVSTVEQTGA